MYQFNFVRENTLNYVREIDDHWMEVVPRGLNNNIKWNLGHIYLISEKLAFQLTGEVGNSPKELQELFNSGTSPKEWKKEIPKKQEVLQLLREQLVRVESLLIDRTEDKLEKPYTTSTGLELVTIGDCISFCLYHEGMHFSTIKNINQILQK